VAAAGHDHADLLRALAADTERLREDYTAIHGRPPRSGQGFVHRVWMGATLICGTLATVALLQLDWPVTELSGTVAAITSAISLFGSGVAWRASVFGGFRQRFWASWIGRGVFTLAGLGRRKGDLPPGADRPTELAVGLAAEALYAALPDDVRRALPDLPAVVHQLQSDAQRMRRRADDLAEALSSVDGPSAASTSGGGEGLGRRREAVVADLRGAQTTAVRRLSQAVAALEAIRLDLLRLRGGVGTVESITADLAAARELGLETERLLAAQREVDAALAEPVPGDGAPGDRFE
jgi:hypothetical protein